MTLKRAAKLLLSGLLTIIVLGTIINIKLSTKKIAMRDFSETIEAKGKYGIASLEMSFNQMEKRLLDAKSSQGKENSKRNHIN